MRTMTAGTSPCGTKRISQTHVSVGVLALMATLVSSAASAQTTAAPAVNAPAQPTVSMPKPPTARQIEPMVAPVRRVQPSTVAATTLQRPTSASGLAAAPQAAPAKTTASKSAPATAPVAAQASPAQAAPVAGTVAKTTGVTVAAAPPKPTAKPKFAAYTCKIGQDYSEKLKACVTPGVGKVSSTVRGAVKTARAKIGGALDTGLRSSLGVKPKQ